MTRDQTYNESSPLSGLSEKTKNSFDYVMGVDFGTTFSGISYARTNELDESKPFVTDISKWPGGSVYSQTPTKLLYSDGVFSKWGEFDHFIDKYSKIVSLFKLHLDETENSFIPDLPEGLSIEKVVSYYLKAIVNHACSEISQHLGSALEKNKLRFCLTVPGTWTEISKSIMRQAVIEAGIIDKNDPQDRLLLVSESEAIGKYCETFNDEFNLKPGQNFLICDAGGGTVDIAVYRKFIDENDKSSLREEIPCVGEMIGSETLDIRFREFVSKRVQMFSNGQKPLTDKELDAIVKIFAKETKMQVLHPSSPDYDDDYFYVRLPDRFSGLKMKENRAYIADSTLYIHPELMISEIFDPVVNQVTSLVDRQLQKIERKLDAICLVGGFGQSAYLIQTIKEKFKNEVSLIWAPTRGEMAIVRGAVLMGLNPQFVKQRAIRRTYGYECSLLFDKKLDPDNLRSVSNVGTYYCNNRFQSYALKGEIKDVDYYAHQSFKSYSNRDPLLVLYAYDGDPEYLPRYTTDESVKKVAVFVINLSHLPNKSPQDIVVINSKFYLNQTEIKLEVEIENNIKVYIGSYERAEMTSSTEDMGIGIRDLDIQGVYKESRDKSKFIHTTWRYSRP